jgi:hypothetical protein
VRQQPVAAATSRNGARTTHTPAAKLTAQHVSAVLFSMPCAAAQQVHAVRRWRTRQDAHADAAGARTQCRSSSTNALAGCLEALQRRRSECTVQRLQAGSTCTAQPSPGAVLCPRRSACARPTPHLFALPACWARQHGARRAAPPRRFVAPSLRSRGRSQRRQRLCAPLRACMARRARRATALSAGSGVPQVPRVHRPRPPTTRCGSTTRSAGRRRCLRRAPIR